MQFETRRTDIAELLYRLKNKSDAAAAEPIIRTAAEFLRPHVEKFDCIIPAPPSAQRSLQPVAVLAEGIGAALQKPVSFCVTATRPTAQLKNVSDADERRKLVEGLYAVDSAQTTGKSVLLFDDLFRSGTTLNAITDELLGTGRASVVRVLTITMTRSNR